MTRHSKYKAAAAAAAAVLIMSALAACAGEEPAGQPSDSPVAEDLSLEVIVPRAAAYWASVVCGVKEVAEADGVTVQVQTGKEYTAVDQIPLLNASMARNPSGLVIVPADSTGMVAPLQQAQSDGVLIATAGIGLSPDAPEGLITSAVITDDFKGGQEAGEQLAKAVSEKGTVLVMGTVAGLASTDDRIDGALEALAQYPDIEVLPVEYNKNEVNTASSIVSSVLASHPDLAGILANNLVGVNGAVTGLQQEGKAGGAVKVVGFDADPAEIEAMKAGSVQALIVADPKLLGTEAATQLIAALRGETAEASVRIANTIVTPDNVDSPEVDALINSSVCD